MFVEEIGELMEVLGRVLTKFNKSGRDINGCSTHDFLEELADVDIMKEQLLYILDSREEFQEIFDAKLRKLEKITARKGDADG